MDTLILAIKTIIVGLIIFGTPSLIALGFYLWLERFIDRRDAKRHARARAMWFHPASKNL